MHDHAGHVHIQGELDRAHVDGRAARGIEKFDQDVGPGQAQATFGVVQVHCQAVRRPGCKQGSGRRGRGRCGRLCLLRLPIECGPCGQDHRQRANRREVAPPDGRGGCIGETERSLRAPRVRQMPPAPGHVDGGIEQEFEDRRGDDTADHRRGDALHHVGAGLGLGGPHDRQQAEEDRADSHDLGADPLDRAVHDGVVQVGQGVQAPGGLELVPGMVQVEKHDDPRLGVQAGQGYQPHPDGDAQVVVEQVQEPEGPDEGERHRKQYDRRPRRRLRVHIDQDKYDEQREGNHDSEPLFRALHVLELAGPLGVVAGRKVDALGNTGVGLLDIAVDVVGRHVDEHEPDQLAILVADGGRPGAVGQVCNLADGNLRPGRGGDEDPFQGVEVASIIPRIADADGVPLPPLHRGCNGVAADGRLDDVVHVADRESVPCRRLAVHGKVQKVAPRGSFGEDAAGVRQVGQRLLDLNAKVLDPAQVRSEHLDAQHGAEARGEHLSPRLDRHPEDIGHARGLQPGVHLCDDPVPGHARPPLVVRLQRNDRLEHRKRSRVRRRLRLAGLSKDRRNLGDLLQEAVLDLQDSRGFADGDAGDGRGHEEDSPLVQRRHEFAAEAAERDDGRRKHDGCGRQREPAVPQDKVREGTVGPDQESVDRVFLLRRDFPPDEHQHQDRHQGHAEKGGKPHGKGLGEGERLEEPALLRGQGEDRHKAHRDHQEREKQRPAHAARGCYDDLDTLRPIGLTAVVLPEVVELLVRVLDHDDRGVHHGPDRDCDPPQRHDVRGQAQGTHGNEREEDRDRESDDRDQRRADVPEKDETDKGDDDALLDELFTQGGYGRVDQLAPVIGRDNLHPRRE